jgi:hypothetical protein
MPKRSRQKIPIGAGAYFVLMPSTLRFALDGPDGEPVADLLVNASGYGAIVTVPPGAEITGGPPTSKVGPMAAVELLRRCNLYRLSSGRAQHAIPPALIKRAKSETLPGLAALVPFPGYHKQYFPGVGPWVDTGLWVSSRGECALEMQSTSGFIRKALTLADAAVWLTANGHATPWGTIPGGVPAREPPPPADVWEIVTSGDKRAGSTAAPPDIAAAGVPVTRENAATIARQLKAKTAGERDLRQRVASAPTIAPPPISPPVKTRGGARSRRRR